MRVTLWAQSPGPVACGLHGHRDRLSAVFGMWWRELEHTSPAVTRCTAEMPLRARGRRCC